MLLFLLLLQVLDLSRNEFDDSGLGVVAGAARHAAGLAQLVLLGNKTPFALPTLRALMEVGGGDLLQHLGCLLHWLPSWPVVALKRCSFVHAFCAALFAGPCPVCVSSHLQRGLKREDISDTVVIHQYIVLLLLFTFHDMP